MGTINLIWRNSVRNKIRFALTLLSVAIAFFLYTAYSGINTALTASVTEANQLRLNSSHKVSLTRGLPVSYKQKMRSIEGVTSVSYASWFGGYVKDETQQISVFAVDHESYFQMHPEYALDAEQLTRWQKQQTGILVGQKLADNFGWKVGDKVPISTSIWMNRDGHFTWFFTVSAIFQGNSPSVNDNQAFFHHQYFDEARAFGRYEANWFIPQIDKTANAAKVSLDIDAFFENAVEPTRTSTEQVFKKEQTQQFADMAMILRLAVIAVFFTLLLIVCNTMMQVIRERRRETAIMKTSGFSSSYLIILLFLESLLLFGSGAFLGGLVGFIALDQLQYLFSDFLPGISLSPNLFIEMALMIALGAIISSVFPAITLAASSITSDLGTQS
ncbi:ABC transporter permease [Alteromonas sediminis]|uniref:ABC transporter permease n=1 Tax=Alteromonas sediminis TaxID=2259342 RepID=UPI0014054B79|nr:FtsX-like permease family protein [Alteromonas sediminis]